MNNLRIGIRIAEPTAPKAIDAIVRAEEMGIEAVWMTSGFFAPDTTAIYAAAALRTSHIKLGTSIVPIYPRHPFALAQEAKVVAQLAPGRFRLGVGPSHRYMMEDMWGLSFRKPLTYLREYVHLLKAALQQGGPVRFQGEFFRVNADWGEPVDLQIMASALRGKSYELLGEVADGAISWVTPLSYIQGVALPALAAGAAKAGRPRPAMIMHLGVCLHEAGAEVREAAREQFAVFAQVPFYVRMFVEAGFPEVEKGAMPEALLESIVIQGGEASVAEQLRKIAASGVDEVICQVFGAGPDKEQSASRTLQFLAELCQSP